jgi:hypothetical protein
VIHGSLLVAVHEHPLVAVTDTDPGPPAASTDRDVGAIE